MKRLIVLGLVSAFLASPALCQHRVNLDPFGGNVSITEQISSRNINGAKLDVRLTYSANVEQILFGEYTPDGVDEITLTWRNDSWQTYTRMHGAWMLSINGFVVQMFSNLPVDPGANKPTYNEPPNNANGQNWFTRGYDVCSRLFKINTHAEQDVIYLLLADGSKLELRNETTWDDVEDDVAELYTGRYYHNAVNSHGFGIVEFEDRYWPESLQDLFGDGAPVPLGLRPRVLRYYPGDGLEYVFREIVAPHGDPSACYGLMGCDTMPKKTVGATIFYLEEINKEHARIADVTRSKHYPTEGVLDILPGRALFTGTTGVFVDYGDDIVHIQSQGSTHRLVLRNTARFGTLFSETSYGDDDSGEGTMAYPALGFLSRYPSDIQFYCETATDSRQRLLVREHIGPSGERTVFDYSPRIGSHADQAFTAALLTSVRDKDGTTKIAYHTELGHDYENEDVEWMLGQTKKEFFTVAKQITTLSSAATPDTLATTVFDLYDNLGSGIGAGLGTALDTLNGSVISVPHRWSTLFHKDHTFGDDRHITMDRYIWNRLQVEPYFEMDRDPTTEILETHYHFWPYIHRRTTWATQTETVRRDTLVDASSRMNILPVSVVTRYRDTTSASFTPIAKTEYTYSFEQQNDAFTKTDLSQTHRRVLTSRETKHYDGASTAGFSERYRAVASYIPLLYEEYEDCWVKDTTVDELATRRKIDSARSLASTDDIRLYNTPSAASEVLVRCAPLLSLVDHAYITDTLGTVLGGVDHQWYLIYDCQTSSSGVPTYPRGGLQWTETVGQAAPSTPFASAPRIGRTTLYYTHSFWNMYPRMVVGPLGETVYTGLVYDTYTATLTRSDGSQSTERVLADDFLTNGPNTVTAPVRRTLPISSNVVLPISSRFANTYDGSMMLSRDANGHGSASRSDHLNESATTWAAGTFPTDWSQRHPWVKLWNAQTAWVRDSDPATYDNRRLIAQQSFELLPEATGLTASVMESSRIELAYVAHESDILHTQPTHDSVILRLHVADICVADYALPTPM